MSHTFLSHMKKEGKNVYVEPNKPRIFNRADNNENATIWANRSNHMVQCIKFSLICFLVTNIIYMHQSI